jgi:putative heme-binding domain-containing protein
MAGPKPIVFLDKSAKVVKFQLDRLSPTQLLMVERSDDDPRSRPVYQAILLREGVSRQDREVALAALGKSQNADAVSVLLASIEQLGGDSVDNPPVGRQLAAMLLRENAAQIKQHQRELYAAAASSSRLSRAVGYAALITCGESETAWEKSSQNDSTRSDFLIGLTLVPDAKLRSALRPKVVASLESSQPPAVRLAAIEALAAVPTEPAQNFTELAQFVAQPRFRNAAVRSMLRIPKAERSVDDAREVVQALVDNAESTPAARRTTDAFLDGMQLADELIAALPVDESRAFRERLRSVAVRVVRIGTVQEEMRYDQEYFAVEAGRPVQIVLRNEDLMPHNLLITAPGALRDVAALAATLTPQPNAQGRQYVPDSPLVLEAMKTVPSSSQEVLTFTAPREPGEYPYVCTFPQHWTRMYGVMVVVPDLDAWQADPKPPADPLGNTREIVQNWNLEDFPVDLAPHVSGRSTEIGQRLFKEAMCANCHKLRGEGGAVGPELSEIYQKQKGDLRAVLREMLEPSRAIDEKYALYNIVTDSGKIVSGIIVGQDAGQITLITNPDNPQPLTLERDEIEELVKSSVSMMPKGVLDRYTQDEIYEILGLIQHAASTSQ